MNYFLYIIFAIAPSVIWLLFYLKKDAHPESRHMILKIFFLGMLVAGLAAMFELGIFELIILLFPSFLHTNSILIMIFRFFVLVALIEEFAKYIIVKRFVLADANLDEPLDIMLYMIVSALGFAALENLLVLFPFNGNNIQDNLILAFSRFLGATFLHTLASGTIGYFLAMSFSHHIQRKSVFILGFAIAVILHGLYNLSIISFEGKFQSLTPVAILLGLLIFTTWGFQKLKKLKGLSKVSV